MFMPTSRLLVELSGKSNSEVRQYIYIFLKSNISKWSYIFINVNYCNRLLISKYYEL